MHRQQNILRDNRTKSTNRTDLTLSEVYIKIAEPILTLTNGFNL